MSEAEMKQYEVKFNVIYSYDGEARKNESCEARIELILPLDFPCVVYYVDLNKCIPKTFRQRLFNAEWENPNFHNRSTYGSDGSFVKMQYDCNLVRKNWEKLEEAVETVIANLIKSISSYFTTTNELATSIPKNKYNVVVFSSNGEYKMTDPKVKLEYVIGTDFRKQTDTKDKEQEMTVTTKEITEIPGFKKAKKPIVISIEEDGKYFTVISKELGELAYGLTLDEAMDSFYDSVSVSYEAYAICPIEELHETAYKVREIYLEYFGGHDD